MRAMNQIQKILIPLAVILLSAWAWQSNGWAGIAYVASGGVLWFLLYFTRMVQAMRRASKRPIGFVDSAVMLNAKLSVGMGMLHVIALTQAIGRLETERNAQPEVFSWRDGSQSVVRMVFYAGKLQSWTLERPFQATDVTPVKEAAND
jgi:hypothetical protein